MASKHKHKHKHKHNDSTPSVRTFTYTHADLSDSEEPAPMTQTNVFMRTTHNSQGCTTQQTIHTTFDEPKEPALDAIYGALVDSSESTTYGNEEFHAPLEDDNMSQAFIEHKVPKDDTTVSLLDDVHSYHSADEFRS